jgi:hypothetical protein
MLKYQSLYDEDLWVLKDGADYIFRYWARDCYIYSLSSKYLHLNAFKPLYIEYTEFCGKKLLSLFFSGIIL